MRNKSNESEQRTRRMNYGHCLFFVALTFLAALPAFADMLPGGLREMDHRSLCLRTLPDHKALQVAEVARSIAPVLFAESEFPIAKSSPVPWSDFNMIG